MKLGQFIHFHDQFEGKTIFIKRFFGKIDLRQFLFSSSGVRLNYTKEEMEYDNVSNSTGGLDLSVMCEKD